MNTLKLEVVRFDSEDVIATSLLTHRVRPFFGSYATFGAEAYQAGYDNAYGPLNNGTLYPIELFSTESDDFYVDADDAQDESSGFLYAWYVGGDIDAWYTENRTIHSYTDTNTKFPR